jgi:hypothetical protein
MKGIGTKRRKGETYLKPLGSCGTRCAPLAPHRFLFTHSASCSHLHRCHIRTFTWGISAEGNRGKVAKRSDVFEATRRMRNSVRACTPVPSRSHSDLLFTPPAAALFTLSPPRGPAEEGNRRKAAKGRGLLDAPLAALGTRLFSPTAAPPILPVPEDLEIGARCTERKDLPQGTDWLYFEDA